MPPGSSEVAALGEKQPIPGSKDLWYRIGTGCIVLSVQIVHGQGHIGNDGPSETHRRLNPLGGAERPLIQIQSPRLTAEARQTSDQAPGRRCPSIAACAPATRAIGTRKEEQLTLRHLHLEVGPSPCLSISQEAKQG